MSTSLRSIIVLPRSETTPPWASCTHQPTARHLRANLGRSFATKMFGLQQNLPNKRSNVQKTPMPFYDTDWFIRILAWMVTIPIQLESIIPQKTKYMTRVDGSLWSLLKCEIMKTGCAIYKQSFPRGRGHSLQRCGPWDATPVIQGRFFIPHSHPLEQKPLDAKTCFLLLLQQEQEQEQEQQQEQQQQPQRQRQRQREQQHKKKE